MSIEGEFKRVPKVVRDLAARAIEEEGYDAGVILFSKVVRNRTSVFMHIYGNELACTGLAEWAYVELAGETEVEEEDD